MNQLYVLFILISFTESSICNHKNQNDCEKYFCIWCAVDNSCGECNICEGEVTTEKGICPGFPCKIDSFRCKIDNFIIFMLIIIGFLFPILITTSIGIFCYKKIKDFDIYHTIYISYSILGIILGVIITFFVFIGVFWKIDTFILSSFYCVFFYTIFGFLLICLYICVIIIKRVI